MAEILLCSQPTRLNTLESQAGISVDSVSGLSCVNPAILSSYTPYSLGTELSVKDKTLMQVLSPAPVSRELTNLSLCLGEDNTLALSDTATKL